MKYISKLEKNVEELTKQNKELGEAHKELTHLREERKRQQVLLQALLAYVEKLEGVK